MGPPEPNNFPDRVKAHRRRTGQSQRALAERLGVTPLTIIKWEKGTWPGRTLARLLQELRTTEEAPTSSSTPTGVVSFPLRNPAYQLNLPFDEPVEVILRMGPQAEGMVQVEVRFERRPA
jgi:transcriptional regulator with XRE-family HTH domain